MALYEKGSIFEWLIEPKNIMSGHVHYLVQLEIRTALWNLADTATEFRDRLYLDKPLKLPGELENEVRLKLPTCGISLLVPGLLWAICKSICAFGHEFPTTFRGNTRNPDSNSF